MASNVETGRIMSTGVANLTGNGLSNTLVAGAGSNKFDGAAGRDTVDYSRAAAGVSANLASGAAQATGGSGRDTFVSIENLSGSAFADRLSGNSGANVLVGLNGNDTIAGAAGNDTLTGGAGKDAFLFNTLPGTTNVDTLTDFRIVDDTILLENGVFVALSLAGTVSEDQFRSGLGVFAVDANDHLLYELSNGGLYYDADGNGAMPAELFARFARPADLSDSVPLLTASDIFIV
jgi:Ca2+-binding RTX toxin-like protein